MHQIHSFCAMFCLTFNLNVDEFFVEYRAAHKQLIAVTIYSQVHMELEKLQIFFSFDIWYIYPTFKGTWMKCHTFSLWKLSCTWMVLYFLPVFFWFFFQIKGVHIFLPCACSDACFSESLYGLRRRAVNVKLKKNINSEVGEQIQQSSLEKRQKVLSVAFLVGNSSSSRISHPNSSKKCNNNHAIKC